MKNMVLNGPTVEELIIIEAELFNKLEFIHIRAKKIPALGRGSSHNKTPSPTARDNNMLLRD